MSTSRKLAYSALLFNTLIWGCAFAIVKPALDIISPTQYLYFRFLIAGIVALPIFLYYYLKLRPKISYILKVLLLELAGTLLPLYVLYEGLSMTGALEASLIGATGPIFIVLAGMWFLHERETKREWQGLGLSLLGSLIIVAEPLLFGQHDTTSSAQGNLYILGYNVLNMLYIIAAKKMYKKRPPLYMGAPTYLLTAAFYGLLLAFKSQLPSFDILYSNFDILFAVLYMAIPGTILAFMCYQYAASKIEVSEANLFTYLHGVVAIPAAFFLLGESPSWLTLLAVATIAYGVYRAEKKK